MTGDGPFLWLSERGSPHGFRRLPRGGLCLCAFVFVRRGREILLGKYADDPRWEALAGLDPDRRRAHGRGWTIPASHLKYGEDPREAARRVAAEILQLPGLPLSEPRVESEFDHAPRFPEVGKHHDLWFFFDAEVPEGTEVARPPWYRELAWVDPRSLPAEACARSHEDVVARWLQPR